jgi:hypothetical protein
VAVLWWTGLGHAPPRCLTTRVELPPNVTWVGWYRSDRPCTIQISSELPTRTNRDKLLLCKVVMHEVGHALGLRHTRRGIMTPSVDNVRPPGACWLLLGHPPA